MKVLITGATGLIGKELVKQCHEEGLEINYLTRKLDKTKDADNYKGFLWDIKKQEINADCLNGVSVIIHLAGATISNRWTDEYKKIIIASRVESTQLLVSALQCNDNEVKQVICASAIGIYPDSLTQSYNEDTNEVSETFLGAVVKKWETAVNEFKIMDINVVKLRTGLVLSKEGGALPEITKPIRYFVGSAFGSGKQWQSWIHINDLAAMYIHILKRNLKGVYNGVSPVPQTNAQFTKAVAKQLRRPLLMPNVPQFLMKLVLGEMHILLFESQKVSSTKIEDTGFVFKYQNIQSALSHLLG